jgi:hypothetical protein
MFTSCPFSAARSVRRADYGERLLTLAPDQPIELATSNLLERPLALAHELANFPRDRS